MSISSTDASMKLIPKSDQLGRACRSAALNGPMGPRFTFLKYTATGSGLCVVAAPPTVSSLVASMTRS